jgi:DNA-binding IclR family transcriptional regulator
MNTENRLVTMPGARRNLAKSATRALDVLEYFSIAKRPLRASEIRYAFGWHSSSTDQLLKTMVDSGYLIFETARKLYRPSPRLVRFGAWLAAGHYGGERLQRLLNLVYGRSGEIVTLAVRQDDHMQVVDVVQPVASPRPAAPGLKVPLIGSALGGAYLAAQSDREIMRIVSWIDRHRGRGADQVDAVMEDVRAIRARGHASGGVGEDRDNWSIAIALPTCDAGVGLVLGFAGPVQRIRPNEAELAALLRRSIGEVLTPDSTQGVLSR